MYLSAYRALNILLGIILVLLAIHLSLQAASFFTDYGDLANAIKDRFDVDHEASVPTWFSQTLLFVAAALAWLAGRGSEQAGYWRALAVILLLMSIDEGASFHETAGVWLGQTFNAEIQLGFVTLRDWVVVGLLAAAAITAVFWRFLWQLPAYTRYTLIAGGLVFFSGALGWESLHFTTFQFGHDNPSFPAQISAVIEEGLEMVGASLMVYALLDYINKGHAKARSTSAASQV